MSNTVWFTFKKLADFPDDQQNTQLAIAKVSRCDLPKYTYALTYMLIDGEELLTYPEDAKPFKDNITIACFGKVITGIIGGFELGKILYLEFEPKIKIQLIKIKI